MYSRFLKDCGNSPALWLQLMESGSMGFGCKAGFKCSSDSSTTEGIIYNSEIAIGNKRVRADGEV